MSRANSRRNIDNNRLRLNGVASNLGTISFNQRVFLKTTGGRIGGGSIDQIKRRTKRILMNFSTGIPLPPVRSPNINCSFGSVMQLHHYAAGSVTARASEIWRRSFKVLSLYLTSLLRSSAIEWLRNVRPREL